jgi:SAM-dependent methyltransferase
MALHILAPDQHDAEDYFVDQEALPTRWAMEDEHFWFRARNEWIRELLRREGLRPGDRIIDVGCGSGAVSRSLSRMGLDVTGIDTVESFVRKAESRCPDGTFYVGRVQLLSDVAPFDAIGLFDVLEHLDAPLELLTAAMKLGRPGALVVATVPAMRSLFSAMDVATGHKRRFDPGELAELLREAGLSDPKERSIFRAISYLMRARRSRWDAYQPGDSMDDETRRAVLRADDEVPNPIVNTLLRGVCSIERRLLLGSSSGKSGGSLLGVARIPTPSAGPIG